MTYKKKHPHTKLIELLGGTTVEAKIYNVKKPSVSAWRKNGIPEARMMYLEIKYKNIIKKFREENND